VYIGVHLWFKPLRLCVSALNWLPLKIGAVLALAWVLKHPGVQQRHSPGCGTGAILDFVYQS
jgi:hypothetical protein